ncbi:MAG: alpha-galactosidase [Bacteroidia bacterium]|nr:alpha-galactosidase [Bacteroidia bacterium]
MKKLLGISTCLIIFAFLQGCSDLKRNLVNVKLITSQNSTEPKVIIEEGKNGQNYIRILLTNKGQKTDYIDSIEIVIKQNSVVDDTKLLFGGTCMGRTPLKQSNASDTLSNSDTFLMIRHNENSFSQIGVLTWNTFLPYIHYNIRKGIVITANGESKPINPGETIEFEKLVLSESDSWQDLMFNYGKEIAKEHKIEPKKPIYFKGWSSWDYYGRVYNTKDIIENIDQLITDGFDANIIQIDGGWWTARGDYLSVRKNLQGGMKAIADYAKLKGYRAGIHLDGFRGDKNSDLYRAHPDWFLKDQDGEVICQTIDKGDAFMQYIYFDYSNPDVCEYMKNVLKTIRKDWGYSYFKIDFMRYGLLESILAEHGNNYGLGKKPVTKVISFNNSMTSIERTRAGLKAMREGMGDAFFLGCSAIFGPTFGIVDGLRTGADICSTFDYYEACSLQNAGNFYLNQNVVQNDADYLVVRNKDDEESERAWGENKFGGNTTLNEAKMWSDYIALYGGPKINSDNLLTLRDGRKKLIENAFSIKTATRFIPLDLWDHARDKNDAFNIMLAENEDGVYLSLFNWDNNDIQFVIDGFANAELTDILTKERINLNDGILRINSKTHTSIILKIEGESFDSLRKTIQCNT